MLLAWMTMWMIAPHIQVENKRINMFASLVVEDQGNEQMNEFFMRLSWR